MEYTLHKLWCTDESGLEQWTTVKGWDGGLGEGVCLYKDNMSVPYRDSNILYNNHVIQQNGTRGGIRGREKWTEKD